jgi:DNA-binding PucR family transcriptional regulator
VPVNDQCAIDQPTRETLLGFARACTNIKRCAADLHIHENTLRYRLRRIKERTGHDPQTFDGLLELIYLLEVVEGEQLPLDHLHREPRVKRP